MHCGQPAVPVSSGNGKKVAVVAVVCIAVMIASFFALRAAGFLRAESSQSTPNPLRAEGSRSPGILRAEGNQRAAPLNAEASRKRMPDNVRAWLEHLERIEAKRGELSSDQMTEAVMTLTELQLGGTLDSLGSLLEAAESDTDPVSPSQEVKKDFEGYDARWTELNREFHSMPPPTECIAIRDEYDVVLKETGGMILEIVDQIQNAENDRKGALKTLTGMKGTSERRIGVPSRKTDRLIGELCDGYDTRKWFSIASDFGGNMFGKLGF